MDYEKKYNEALELARVAAFNGHQSLMEGIFPELVESEDEKTRKRIIALVNAHGQGMYKGDMLAWLEKQENCEYIRKDWLEHIKQSWYKEGFIDGKYTPKELTINDAATLNELIDFLENGTVKLQHDLTLYANWLKTQFSQIEKQGEQKPAEWSEKDDMMIEETLYFLREYQQSNRCKDENGMQNSVSCEKWLKSLKERIGG